MSYKEKLNAILRLRLMFSTEREMSERIGYQLHGNHFNRMKPFQCEAYFCWFANFCSELTQGRLELNALLRQYEATSDFYKAHIEGTAHERNKAFLPHLLRHAYMGAQHAEGAQDSKLLLLCEQYDQRNREGDLNPAILLLITHGIIPTFCHKKDQDITNLAADLRRVHDLLRDIAERIMDESFAKFSDHLCLRDIREMAKMAEEDKGTANRVSLIFATAEALSSIYANLDPNMMRLQAKRQAVLDITLPRLMRCDADADNVVWELTYMPHLAMYLAIRNEIDQRRKVIRYSRYQLAFYDFGDRDMCGTKIIRPHFAYYCTLGRDLPADCYSYDYTDIAYEADRKTVKTLTFNLDSPTGVKPFALKAVKRDDQLRYYDTYLNHKGVAKDYTDVEADPAHAVKMATLDVYSSEKCLIFDVDGSLWQVDKYDDQGNETVPGIGALTHEDNFLYIGLVEDGCERHFIRLDSINQSLDIDELVEKPWFRILS